MAKIIAELDPATLSLTYIAAIRYRDLFGAECIIRDRRDIQDFMDRHPRFIHSTDASFLIDAKRLENDVKLEFDWIMMTVRRMMADER